MLTEKRCFKCSITKPISEFYPHKQMLDGHLNKCKECAKKDVTEKYNINKQDNDYVEKERARGREKFHRLYAGVKSNDSGFERTRRYRNKYPEKKNATHAVHKAKLVKPFDGAEAHHWSYNDEHFFDVIWLTVKQHNKSHRFMYYDQSVKKYRRSDNHKVLDTKDEHNKYIKFCMITKPD